MGHRRSFLDFLSRLTLEYSHFSQSVQEKLNTFLLISFKHPITLKGQKKENPSPSSLSIIYFIQAAPTSSPNRTTQLRRRPRRLPRKLQPW